MRTAVVLGAAACVVFLVLVAAMVVVAIPHRAPPPPPPAAPRSTGACDCTDEDHPVCNGPKRWLNQCHAMCDGEYGATTCPGVPPKMTLCNLMITPPDCYDSPFAVMDPCPGLPGFDRMHSRECLPGESDRFKAMRQPGVS